MLIWLNKMKNLLGVALLFISLVCNADIFINISATMVEPVCNIRSENGSAPLKIGFDTLTISSLTKSPVVKDFSLYISDCNFNNTLAIVLNPKGGSTLLYKGKNILATSTDGLGIDINEVTGGTIRSLETSKKHKINPERINSTLYRVDLQAQLVNTVPINKLKLGKFNSIVTISVTYN